LFFGQEDVPAQDYQDRQWCDSGSLCACQEYYPAGRYR